MDPKAKIQKALDPKEDQISVSHLQWLVKARAANQNAAIALLELLRDHSDQLDKRDFPGVVHRLAAVCFSLWRAAFLADKIGTREKTLKHATEFFGKMLADNAITYVQDRATREWTFNYYMTNATDSLLQLGKRWPAVTKKLEQPRKVPKGSNAAQRKWIRHQEALEIAVKHLQEELAAPQSKKNTRRQSNA